ncbi:hypothetical protein JR316_0008657 [Psilocybe cubensis]|uniref:Uncharacterized protein n=2 Tax=Psilocybe cubensis TaxID=181762 RepID=A0ACB8GT56_PSICU|nr:hypothetical protein JR316_0008657 [Psilocybe cubensis]KAH9478204.1 hypothetical protein JR316_0008657 [Psilocybe cubensis]
MYFSAFILTALATAAFTSATPLVPGRMCQGRQAITSTQYIGAEKNVKLDIITCEGIADSATIESGVGALLESRQTASVCDAPCTTFCHDPAGGGPDPNDCHIIADALRFESQSISPTFEIDNGANNVVSLTFSSCTSFFLNQASTGLNYCRTDFASLTDFLSTNCQATQNAHGGLCVANDGRWFVQVQHS